MNYFGGEIVLLLLLFREDPQEHKELPWEGLDVLHYPSQSPACLGVGMIQGSFPGCF